MSNKNEQHSPFHSRIPTHTILVHHTHTPTSLQSLKEDNVPEVVKENAPQAHRQSKKNCGSNSSKRQPLRSLLDEAVSIRSPVADLPVTAQHAERQSSQRKRVPFKKKLLENRSLAAKKKFTSSNPASVVQSVRVAKNMSKAAPHQQKKRRLATESDDADAHVRGEDETEIIGGEDTEILGENETEILDEEVAHTMNATGVNLGEDKEPSVASADRDARASGGVQPAGNIAESPQRSDVRTSAGSQGMELNLKRKNSRHANKGIRSTKTDEVLLVASGGPIATERLDDEAEADAAIDEVIRGICEEASPLQEKAKDRGPWERSQGIAELVADYERRLEQLMKQGRTTDEAGASMQQPSVEKTVKDLEMSVRWYHKEREELEEESQRLCVMAKHYGDLGQANSVLKNKCTELWHKGAELEDANVQLQERLAGMEANCGALEANITVLVAKNSEWKERLREVEGERDELRNELALLRQTCRCPLLGAAGDLADNDKGSVPRGGTDVQTEEPRGNGNVGTTPGPVRGNPPGLDGVSETAMEMGDCEHRNCSPKANGEGSVESDEKNGLDSGSSARSANGETKVASPVPIVHLEPHKLVSPSLEAVNSPQMNAALRTSPHPWGSMLSTPPVAPHPPFHMHAANGWASQLGTPFGNNTPAWLRDIRGVELTPRYKTVAHAMRHSSVSGWKEMIVRAASQVLPSSPAAPCGDPLAVNGSISGNHSSENQPGREVESSPYVQAGASPGVRDSNGKEVEEEMRGCSHGLGSGPCCPRPGSDKERMTNQEQLSLDRQMLPLANEELSFEKLLKFLTGFKVEWAPEGTRESLVFTHEATGYSFSLSPLDVEDETEANGAPSNCIEQPELEIEYKPIKYGLMAGRLPRCLEGEITVSAVDGPQFQKKILNCIHS